MKRIAPLLLVLVLLAGCTQSTPSSAEKFTGAEAEVAQKIEDLEKAGKSRKPDDICSDILATSLVDQLKEGGTDCETEMQKAIEDADDFALDVRKVTVTGNTATAEVQRGDDGPTVTMTFERQGSDWRATSLSSNASR
jgi:PBP1b-binding outer membrane lipoprotein LpoB